MRISTASFFTFGLNSIQDNLARVYKDQTQLSSGMRILDPADDPTSAALIIGLTESIGATEKYQDNAGSARARLGVQDGTLAAVIDGLQRARELAVQGLNATQTPSDRQSLALEVRQIIDLAMGQANSKDGNGEFLFAGYQSKGSTVPFSDDGAGTFSYGGDQGQRMLQIGPNRQIAVSDSGMDIFMKIGNATGTGFKSVFASLYDLADGLENDNPSGDTLIEMDNAIDNILRVQARIGSRMNSIDTQIEVNAAALERMEERRSSIRDLDYAEAVTRFNQDMVALQAAQQSFAKIQNLSLFNFL